MPNAPWCHDCNKPEGLCECIVDGPGEVPEWAMKVAEDLSKRVQIDVAAGMIWDIRQSIALALLKAREEAFEECAKLIEEGFDRDVANPYRDDGKPSKNDECSHGRFVYEDCEQCAVIAIRQHSQKGER